MSTESAAPASLTQRAATAPALAAWSISNPAPLTAYLSSRATTSASRVAYALASRDAEGVLRKMPASQFATLYLKLTGCGVVVAAAVSAPEVVGALAAAFGAAVLNTSRAAVGTCARTAAQAVLSLKDQAVFLGAAMTMVRNIDAATSAVQLRVFEQSVRSSSSVTVTARESIRQGNALFSGRCSSSNLPATVTMTLLVQSGGRSITQTVSCRGGSWSATISVGDFRDWAAGAWVTTSGKTVVSAPFVGPAYL